MLIKIVQKAADSVGGVSELARRLNLRHTAFYRWKTVPPERVLQIEKITGISRHDMRPDLYPIEEDA
jgi:DNA-binding transcriptional regulator YdaS (Cro superfamily)